MLMWSTAPVLANNVWNGYHWADSNTDLHDGSSSLTLVDDLTAYETQYPAVLSDWDGTPGPLTLSPVDGGV